jgi:hypothetical protein
MVTVVSEGGVGADPEAVPWNPVKFGSGPENTYAGVSGTQDRPNVPPGTPSGEPETASSLGAVKATLVIPPGAAGVEATTCLAIDLAEALIDGLAFVGRGEIRY